MSIAGTAFFARIVENAVRTVPPLHVRVARASGASRLQVILSVQLHGAIPILFGGLTINSIAMVDYSAIAGTIGAGGLGYVAVVYGYQRRTRTSCSPPSSPWCRSWARCSSSATSSSRRPHPTRETAIPLISARRHRDRQRDRDQRQQAATISTVTPSNTVTTIDTVTTINCS